MSKKVIIFDLDDTLILEKDYVKSGFSVVAKKLSGKVSKKVLEIFNDMMVLFEEDSNLLFNRLLDSYNINYSKEDILKFIEIYRNHKPNINLLPDAKEILEYLYKNGYRMGMITDGYAITQRRKLETLDIEKKFEHIVVTDELGREFWKPSEVPYKLMKEKMGVEYSQMVYIGDNPTKDFISANKLGILTVQILTEGRVRGDKIMEEKFKSKYIINSLLELKGIV